MGVEMESELFGGRSSIWLLLLSELRKERSITSAARFVGRAVTPPSPAA
jgi:hypothetical protein